MTGYVLTVACQVEPSAAKGATGMPAPPDGIGKVYLLDNFGNVLGGLAFLIVFAYLLNHFEMLYFAALLNLLFAGFVAAAAGKRMLAATAAVILATLGGVVARYDLDDISRRLEYAGQRVVFHGDSPYGSLVVTQAAGQLNFIESGVPLFSTHNVEQIEETVHYAMAQRPNARRVLLISGGASGTAREVLKYPVQAVDYVELDPLILDVARKFLPASLADSRIHVIQSDGRLLVRQTPALRRGDRRRAQSVHLATEPLLHPRVLRRSPPDSRARRRAVVLAGNLRELSQQGTRPTHRRGAADAAAGVSRVLILPGGRVFFLASDGELTADVAGRMERAGVRTRLVNRDYLKGMLTADRMADLRRAISAEAPVNEDFSPILYYYHLRYWMSQFQVRLGIFEVFLACRCWRSTWSVCGRFRWRCFAAGLPHRPWKWCCCWPSRFSSDRCTIRWD